MAKQIAGYFRCGREDVPIFDGGNSIAPFAPYRAPGDARAVAPVQPTRQEIDAAMCTPSRYNSRTCWLWEEEPLPQPRRTVQPPAVEPEQPIVVTDWPTPAVQPVQMERRFAVVGVYEVEPEPVPVVVGDRWAARFGALELRKGGE